MVVPRPKRSASMLTAMTTRAPKARAAETGAVDQPTAAEMHRRKNSRQRVGCAQRQRQRTVR
jgi:hypothetical protein